jgi:RecB family exonuclease
MKWSFSSLKQYTNCPKQYYETRISRNYEIKDNQHTTYGKAVHKAIEEYITIRKEFPRNYKSVLSQIPQILQELPAHRYVEHRMAVKENKEPCDFDDHNYWVRGIVDFMAFDEDRAAVIDWKTGSSRYADTKQLALMALLAFHNFPHLNTVGGLLYFTKNKEFIFSDDYRREDIDKLWLQFAPELMMLELSMKMDNWPVKPSGLCKYCPVVNCVHYKE